jgi:NADP-reducing hydrogenase subunit HndB
MVTPIDIIKKKKEEALKRIEEKLKKVSKMIYVGSATCEIAAGSNDVLKVVQDEVKKNFKDVYIGLKGCRGSCFMEPTLEIVEKGKEPVLYCNVDEKKAKEIIESHLKNGKILEKYLAEKLN